MTTLCLKTRRTAPLLLSAALAIAGLCTPALADSSSRSITVTGEGEATGTPDTAHISAGVVTQAQTAARALAENATAMTNVFAALKRMGIPDKDIQTSDFSVSPQYAPDNSASNGAPRIVGYQVSNQVNLTLDNVSHVGPAIDALVAAGANQMNAISFSIHNAGTLMAQARTAAVNDAVARAQLLTKAAHVTLGPITAIQESGFEGPRPVMMAMRAGPAQTPVAAGEQTLSAAVSITWAIK